MMDNDGLYMAQKHSSTTRYATCLRRFLTGSAIAFAAAALAVGVSGISPSATASPAPQNVATPVHPVRDNSTTWTYTLNLVNNMPSYSSLEYEGVTGGGVTLDAPPQTLGQGQSTPLTFTIDTNDINGNVVNFGVFYGADGFWSYEIHFGDVQGYVPYGDQDGNNGLYVSSNYEGTTIAATAYVALPATTPTPMTLVGSGTLPVQQSPMGVSSAQGWPWGTFDITNATDETMILEGAATGTYQMNFTAAGSNPDLPQTIPPGQTVMIAYNAGLSSVGTIHVDPTDWAHFTYATAGGDQDTISLSTQDLSSGAVFGYGEVDLAVNGTPVPGGVSQYAGLDAYLPAMPGVAQMQ